ncbi:MAG: DUF1566 domain-containing protein [Spirochaetes bacterium]|nr:DUF1566 domain-containing protein [Spirochaetota bacterium]
MKPQLRFMTVPMLCFAMALLSCDTEKKDNNKNLLLLAGGSKTYVIGDIGPSGVGIVFYVTDGGLHGLEVAPVDQSLGSVWSNIASTLVGTTGTAIGTGSANTDAIIVQSEHVYSAAKICRDYHGGGMTDWFLPSRYELNAIWDNLVDDGTGDNSGAGGFADNYYLSSSEDGAAVVWKESFTNGDQGSGPKNTTGRVRAVRAF